MDTVSFFCAAFFGDDKPKITTFAKFDPAKCAYENIILPCCVHCFKLD